MVKRIPLTQGQFALVDDADFALVSQYRWFAQRLPNGRFYAARWEGRNDRGKRHLLYLHVFLLNPVAGVEVDHADNDGLNCQRGNLRYATRGQNRANRVRRTDNTSGFKGVSRTSDGRAWRARIQGHVCLGRFSTPEQAAEAYDDAARSTFGEFACVNFPNEGERAA